MATYPALTRKLSRKWDRHAPAYDRMSEPMEHMLGFAQARARLFAGLRGTILELGVGTGRNLPYYPQDARMIALDLSRGMLERAVYKARALSCHVTFLVGDVEELPFEDASLDAVVGSGVFCCVPDAARGFWEIKRVLKPGGKIVLLEHMRPHGVLGLLFDLLDPLVSRLMGPHINRRTLDSMRAAGLVIEHEENMHSNWVKLVVAR
jgi:ubiquinone/menaquinone biosynthesis C-methylase UbiE